MKQGRSRYNMRPHSAKQGRVANIHLEDLEMDSEMSSRDELFVQSNAGRKSNGGKFSSNEHGRIMPNTFYHDKEQLYSEAIKLKQRTNATLDENTRLKTRIAILEKDKGKLIKFIEQQALRVRTHSRTGTHPSEMDASTGAKSHEREGKLAGMQRLLNQAKQSIGTLKAENTQIKKSVKYSKLSQAQIENRMILEQTGRLRRLLDDYEAELQEYREAGGREDQLQKQMKRLYKQNEELANAVKSYQTEFEDMDDRMKQSQDRHLQRERKANKQLSECKKRLADTVLQCQTLRRELQLSRNQQESQNSLYDRTDLGLSEAESKRLVEEVHRLRIKKQELQRQLNGKQSAHSSVSGAHTGGANQFKGRRPHTSKTVGSKAKELTAQSVQEFELKKEERQYNQSDMIEPIQYNNSRKRPAGQKPAGTVTTALPKSNNRRDQKTFARSNQLQPNMKKNAKPANNIYARVQGISPEKSNMSKEEKVPSPSPKKSGQNSRGSSKESPGKQQLEDIRVSDVVIGNNKPIVYDDYAGDFQQEQPESGRGVQAFAESKTIENKQKQAEKTRRAKLRSINQIKELLTYRLKAQRYPFSQLKKDILESEQLAFHLNDLAAMLAELPFFFNDQQIETVLCYIFDTKDLQQDMAVSTYSFLDKLSQLIDHFILISQSEERLCTTRIVQLIDENAEQLLGQLQKLSNGRGCVTKAELQAVLASMQFSKPLIEMVIGELSLSSYDLTALNYPMLLKIFREEGTPMSEVEQEDELSGDSGLLKQKKKRPELADPQSSDDSLVAQSFSMLAGGVASADFEVLSDEDIRI